MRGGIMRIEPAVHPCFVNLLCTEFLNGFLLHISCIIIPAVHFSWTIWGWLQIFSPSETQSTSQKSSGSLCALYRGMKWPVCCCSGGQQQAWTWNLHLLSPHSTYRMLVPGICYREKSQKGAAVCCSLNKNLANKPCLGQRFSYISAVSSSLGCKGGLCWERLCRSW